MSSRADAIEEIRGNIRRYGYHVYAVAGGPLPRFLYTIGNLDKFGCEVIFAGGSLFSLTEAQEALAEAVVALKRDEREFTGAIDGRTCAYRLVDVHPSWASEILIGAFDYHGQSSVPVLQLVPDEEHSSLDVPDMTRPFSPVEAPVWRWLTEPWAFPVSSQSVAVTDLAALRGEPVTEAARWEEEEWQLFAAAGPDVQEEDVRVVPVATLVAADPTLEAALALPVGSSVWREPGGEWHPWQ